MQRFMTEGHYRDRSNESNHSLQRHLRQLIHPLMI